MGDVLAKLAELGIDPAELRAALNAPPPLWTDAGKGKWIRPGAWLMKTSAGYVELTEAGDVHRYEPGPDPTLPAGFVSSSTGSPLDGHHGAGTGTVEPPAGDASAWQILKRMA